MNPKNIEKLKKITLEEWNYIKIKTIQRSHLESIKRIQKIIDINGSQLDNFHLQ